MAKARQVKAKVTYYPFYKKLLETQTEEPLAETVEYEIFAKTYPYIAKSIMLKKDIERLQRQLKVTKLASEKALVKKDIINLKTKLKRENLLKRLHGESRQEAAFHMHSKMEAAIGHFRSMAKRPFTILGNSCSSIHGLFLSSLFDLRSLHVAERSQTLREWVNTHRQKPSKRLKRTSVQTRKLLTRFRQKLG